MYRVIEIVLTRKMINARVGVIALVLVIFAAQVFLLAKPASASAVGHGMNNSPRIHFQGIEYSQPQDINPSDLAARRALECGATAWLANANLFSARNDARTEYCKALASTASELTMKRALDCNASAWNSSDQSISSHSLDARIEYCKALVAATSEPIDQRTAECESVDRTASISPFSASIYDAKTQYCNSLG
jgi:hypothetical protein